MGCAVCKRQLSMGVVGMRVSNICRADVVASAMEKGREGLREVKRAILSDWGRCQSRLGESRGVGDGF